MAASGIVTLLTDFGTADAYAGVLKAIILERFPGARLVDLTHAVAAQSVLAAAFLLETAWRYFAAGTVHLVVVDPGVGTSRRRLAMAAQGHFFVGPDNACLSAALPDAVRGARSAGEAYQPRTVRLPEGARAVSIEAQALLRLPVSATFEGRDAFAPAAAHLAGGGALEDLGPVVQDVEAFAAFQAPASAGRIDGRVLHVDRYGNLITDILPAALPANPVFRAGGRDIRGLKHTYGAATGLAAIVGSSGTVEIALVMGSAAAVLGLGPGDRVSVTAAPGR